jgi:predicted nuclease of predicted toxin-antitoxin system
VFRRHEPCVLFVDDCLGHKQLIAALVTQGFTVIGHQEKFGKRQSVKDDEIIPYCAGSKLLIATTDKNMVLRHRDLLRAHKQCVIFTTNNSSDNLKVWVPCFTKNKAKIERTWKKREPPWVGRLHPSGHLEIFDLIRYTEYDAETKGKRRR